MSKRLDKLLVNQQEIRIVDGLLLVVGNHGAGKTKLLSSIVDAEYCITDTEPHKIVSLMLSETKIETKKMVYDILNEENFHDFVYSQFDIVDKAELLERIPTIDMLFSNEKKHYLAYRRLAILQLLLKNAEKKIIVIDEPELYAHPLLVRDLCATIFQLQQQGNIIVLATHSETVVSRLFVDIEQIIRLEKQRPIVQCDSNELCYTIQKFYCQNNYLLRRFSSSNQIDTALNNVLRNYIRIYLSSVFRNQIFNVMHADCVILGEGSSEDILFDYLDQIIAPKWMREKRVHYMGCLGKNTMPFYFLLLNHLKIKVVCLFDSDKETNLVHAAYADVFKKYEDDNSHCFSSMVLSPDLEHVLQIVPEHKLLSMEKPVNIYFHTFAKNNVKEKVEEISNLLCLLINQMEDVKR